MLFYKYNQITAGKMNRCIRSNAVKGMAVLRCKIGIAGGAAYISVDSDDGFNAAFGAGQVAGHYPLVFSGGPWDEIVVLATVQHASQPYNIKCSAYAGTGITIQCVNFDCVPGDPEEGFIDVVCVVREIP